VTPHVHADLEDALYITVVAIVGINVVRLAAAWAVQRGGWVGSVGQTVGGLVRLGGQ
jgi:hypothetical protein